MTLAEDHTLTEVAAAIGMSRRWVRKQVAPCDACRKSKVTCSHRAEHLRYGNRIRFTDAQVDALKARFTKAPVVTGITTTRRGRRAS